MNMAFSLTVAQMRARTKTVTRRVGWKTLRPGQRVQAVVKGQGLKPGEIVEVLGPIEIVSVRWEPLHAITAEDVALEGFDMTPGAFVSMFCRHNAVLPNTLVNRIEFRFLEE